MVVVQYWPTQAAHLMILDFYIEWILMDFGWTVLYSVKKPNIPSDYLMTHSDFYVTPKITLTKDVGRCRFVLAPSSVYLLVLVHFDIDPCRWLAKML